MRDPRFPWIERYQEIARRLLDHEARQVELIEGLRALGEPPESLPILALRDTVGGESRPLEVIDPFTVFAAFNRHITVANRQRVVAGIQRLLGLPEDPPEHFDGIPVVNNMLSWFFPYADHRNPDDVPSLWHLARQAVEGGLVGVEAATFERCLGIRTVKIARLTMGLFWLRPDEFMPCDGYSQKLFRARGLGTPRDFGSYTKLVGQLRPEAGGHFAGLSLEALDEDGEDGDPTPEPTSGRERRRAMREDPARAREIMESLYPDLEIRMQTARWLVDAVRRAHAAHPASWCLSLRRRAGFAIRLSVGKRAVAQLREGELRSDVLWASLAEDVQREVEPWVLQAASEPGEGRRQAARLGMPASTFLGFDDRLRTRLTEGRDALIERLSRAGRSAYRRAHSPGVLAYLREFLGEPIPDPEYGDSSQDPWDEFVRWGRAFHRSAADMDQERPGKLEIARKVHAVVEALEDPPEEWVPLLRRAFGPPNNITFYMDHQRFVEWASERPEAARAALEALWDTDRELGERVDRFSQRVPSSVLRAVGSRTNVASFLLAGLGVEEYPPYQSTAYAKGYELTAFGAPAPEASPGAHYEHAIAFLDRMIEEFAERGEGLEDRLAAQCVLWCVVRANRDTTAVAPEQVEDLLRYVGGSPSVWWLVDEKSETAQVEPEQVWLARERLGEEALASDLRLEHLREDEVVLRVDGERIWGISAVRQRALDARRPGGGNGGLGRRVRLDTLPLPQPITLAEIPEDARRLESAVFDEGGEPRPGLLFRLSSNFSRHLRERFADRFPEESPWAPPRRNLWLFQSNPTYWSLAAWLRDRREGDEGEHSVRAQHDEIRPGDRLVLWQSGPEAGAYAFAEVTSEVREQPAGEWLRSRGDAAETEPVVRFRLTKKLHPPLLRSEVRDDPALSDLPVIRAPRGTNYRLTPEQWKALEERTGTAAVLPPPPERTLDEIHQEVQRHGLRISRRTLRRFHHALKTRGFVILCGPSGTGKTWLAECYAEAVGAVHRLVPVAPSWTSNEDLLGHWNPLDGTYHHTEFSRFLHEAAEESVRAEDAGRSPRPHLVILDEMNLARVEHYFAEFLSKMEVRARKGRARIRLGPEAESFLTPNLLFVGTVNVDETTHGFAAKVYDRAQTLELGVERGDLEAHVQGQPYAEALLQFWDAVAPVAPFAFRVADEIRSYVDAARADDVAWEDALDEQLLQKVLPQLAGAEPRLGDALRQIVELAAGRFPLTRGKAQRMLDDFEAHGFASYF